MPTPEDIDRLNTAEGEPTVAGAWDQVPGMVLAPKTTSELWSAIGAVTFRPRLDTKWVFRGLPNASFRNAPSLVRRYMEEFKALPGESQLKKREDALFNLARSWSPSIDPLGLIDKSQVMALMQHHGLPTRLLDVTSNPLTALWFACARQPAAPIPCPDCEHCSKHASTDEFPHESADGIVLAIRVSGLDQVVTNRPILPSLSTEPDSPYVDFNTYMPGVGNWQQALEESSRKAAPFLVQPSNPDPRMTAQEGLFLASAVPPADKVNSTLPFDGIYVPNAYDSVRAFLKPPRLQRAPSRVGGFDVVPIIIRSGLKSDLRKVLPGTFNRAYRTIYPDLAGMVTMLGSRPLQGRRD